MYNVCITLYGRMTRSICYYPKNLIFIQQFWLQFAFWLDDFVVDNSLVTGSCVHCGSCWSCSTETVIKLLFYDEKHDIIFNTTGIWMKLCTCTWLNPVPLSPCWKAFQSVIKTFSKFFTHASVDNRVDGTVAISNEEGCILKIFDKEGNLKKYFTISFKWEKWRLSLPNFKYLQE